MTFNDYCIFDLVDEFLKSTLEFYRLGTCTVPSDYHTLEYNAEIPRGSFSFRNGDHSSMISIKPPRYPHSCETLEMHYWYYSPKLNKYIEIYPVVVFTNDEEHPPMYDLNEAILKSRTQSERMFFRHLASFLDQKMDIKYWQHRYLAGCSK